MSEETKLSYLERAQLWFNANRAPLGSLLAVLSGVVATFGPEWGDTAKKIEQIGLIITGGVGLYLAGAGMHESDSTHKQRRRMVKSAPERVPVKGKRRDDDEPFIACFHGDPDGKMPELLKPGQKCKICGWDPWRHR